MPDHCLYSTPYSSVSSCDSWDITNANSQADGHRYGQCDRLLLGRDWLRNDVDPNRKPHNAHPAAPPTNALPKCGLHMKFRPQAHLPTTELSDLGTGTQIDRCYRNTHPDASCTPYRICGIAVVAFSCSYLLRTSNRLKAKQMLCRIELGRRTADQGLEPRLNGLKNHCAAITPIRIGALQRIQTLYIAPYGQ